MSHFSGAEEHIFHSRQIVADEEKLDELTREEVDGLVSALNERTTAELPGLDLGPVKQLDQEFDDEAFRAIARETFYKVRAARSQQDPRESAELLSPHMADEVASAIQGDVASHRHHLLPFLTVTDAVIAGGQVAGGHEQVDVLFSVSAEEEDLDDRTRQVMASSSTEHSWQERWRFARDPTVDAAASDVRHELATTHADQWLVAHRGWVVTGIERLPAG